MSRSLGGTSFTTLPPMLIVPLVISSSPAIMRSVVDLPQPEGPTSTTNSRSEISRLIRSTTRTPLSYSFTRSLITTPAIGVLRASGHEEEHHSRRTLRGFQALFYRHTRNILRQGHHADLGKS